MTEQIVPEQCEQLRLYALEHPECDQLRILLPPTTFYGGEYFRLLFSTYWL